MATIDENEVEQAKPWWIYKGNGKLENYTLPESPPWRSFGASKGAVEEIKTPYYYEDYSEDFFKRRFGSKLEGARFYTGTEEKDLINAALLLRRPLLITGKPGIGKSSLAFSIAYELGLGPLLQWNITTKTTLQEGLYRYDAIGRLQQLTFLRAKNPSADLPGIGEFIRLGPLGTALLPTKTPRVLLIDEIDKSDIDLPNDLLNVFEEGEFEIPELVREANQEESIEVLPNDGKDNARVTVHSGRVRCIQFPFVIMTSNGERDFPPAFLRRCIRLKMETPGTSTLQRIVTSILGEDSTIKSEDLISKFSELSVDPRPLATDQLLNAIFLTLQPGFSIEDRTNVAEKLMEYLSS